jgi:hypothetical protein
MGQSAKPGTVQEYLYKRTLNQFIIVPFSSIYRIRYLLYPIILFVLACIGDNSGGNSDQFAQKIIDQSIESFGMDKLDHARISFRLRDRSYIYERDDGLFNYTRIFITPEGDTLIDVLTNEGLHRMINKEPAELSDPWTRAYTNSINGVIYYAFLPYRLNDPAVNKEYLETVEIGEKMYHKIRITFTEEDGGEGFEDVYLFWFETETLTMDYFAYQYFSEGGGMRFRKAINRRSVNGITIQDYLNYKPPDITEIRIENIDLAFIQEKLELLSEILLEDVDIDFSPEIE